MQDTTDVERDEPIVELDHDHDDLTALLRDLGALIHKAAGESTRERALAEGRDLLRYFQKDMEAHFSREESDLFPVLRAELPHRAAAIDGLASAHGDFSELVSDIESALNSVQDPVQALRGCRTTISELNTLFVKHSLLECDLVNELDTKIHDPAKRQELRARLEGF